MSRAARFSGSSSRDVTPPNSGEGNKSNRELYAWLEQLRQKQTRGEPLTERELMCLQIVDNGNGCAACAAPTF